mmetsp:Transcript_9099/g.19434  ORF Transcript_9099/g.19434 Transcript_9099/m.19434 type:complete len:82 (+) Transcript_9099:355-600(+)
MLTLLFNLTMGCINRGIIAIRESICSSLFLKKHIHWMSSNFDEMGRMYLDWISCSKEKYMTQMLFVKHFFNCDYFFHCLSS